MTYSQKKIKKTFQDKASCGIPNDKEKYAELERPGKKTIDREIQRAGTTLSKVKALARDRNGWCNFIATLYFT